jgi:hypothetical protein
MTTTGRNWWGATAQEQKLPLPGMTWCRIRWWRSPTR